MFILMHAFEAVDSFAQCTLPTDFLKMLRPAQCPNIGQHGLQLLAPRGGLWSPPLAWTQVFPPLHLEACSITRFPVNAVSEQWVRDEARLPSKNCTRIWRGRRESDL